MPSAPDTIGLRRKQVAPSGLAYSRAFAGALLDPDRQEPDCVAAPGQKAAGRRFDVYRNNVTVSLVNALAESYPAVQRIVGRDFFRAMARLFVRQSPPASPLLFEYGRGFPAFIDGFEPASNLPWLGDVARIERAWLDAYHAADRAPLAAEQLTALPAARLAAARFVAHPAARIVRSAYPAVSIFSANRDENRDGSVEAAGPEDALITRPQLEIIVRWLPAGGADFLERLLGGASLGEAAEAAGETEGFDLAVNIEGMLSSGAFAGVAG
jgi:hypothetical protein